MLVSFDKGQYDRWVLRFDQAFTAYDLRRIENVAPTGLNFVTLDSGVCVCLDEEERLEVFSSRMGSRGLKIVEDSVLGGDMRLSKMSGQLIFSRANKLYRMSLG